MNRDMRAYIGDKDITDKLFNTKDVVVTCEVEIPTRIEEFQTLYSSINKKRLKKSFIKVNLALNLNRNTKYPAFAVKNSKLQLFENVKEFEEFLLSNNLIKE